VSCPYSDVHIEISVFVYISAGFNDASTEGGCAVLCLGLSLTWVQQVVNCHEKQCINRRRLCCAVLGTEFDVGSAGCELPRETMWSQALHSVTVTGYVCGDNW